MIYTHVYDLNTFVRPQIGTTTHNRFRCAKSYNIITAKISIRSSSQHVHGSAKSSNMPYDQVPVVLRQTYIYVGNAIQVSLRHHQTANANTMLIQQEMWTIPM